MIRVWTMALLVLAALPADGTAQRIVSWEQPRDTIARADSVDIERNEPSLAEHAMWGAAIGAVSSVAWGTWADGQQSAPADADSFWNYDAPGYYAINASIVGAATGAASGALVHWLRSR